jgi:hypothetical protein
MIPPGIRGPPEPWTTRAELINVIFGWIEAFYYPTRRHFARAT